MEREERVEEEGRADEWEVICLGEIANLSEVPGDRVTV